ncbi:MAG: VOC family protein [Devosia sp.]
MQFASVRLVTNDIDGLIDFFAMLTGVAATRLAPEFAEIRLPGATLALSTQSPVKQFNAGTATAASNHSAIVEFQVDDVDVVRARLGDAPLDYAMQPATMPWGNRPMLLRDPDGNLVNIFARSGRAA